MSTTVSPQFAEWDYARSAWLADVETDLVEACQDSEPVDIGEHLDDMAFYAMVRLHARINLAAAYMHGALPHLHYRWTQCQLARCVRDIIAGDITSA